MCSIDSFQTISVQEPDTSVTTRFMENNDIYTLLTDSLSVSTDSLSPRSYSSSLSGDEETSTGKRRRSYNSFSLSPKRFKGGAYNIIDDAILPHSPESGIALSPPMALYAHNSNCGKAWIEILEQPEEYYRARYASEGSRGPLKGHSQNSYPKVKLMFEGCSDHVSATITVCLVHADNVQHSVCSLATVEEDGPSNVSKIVTGPDFTVEFDQLRVKRERHTGGGGSKGKQKPKQSNKQNESVGYLLFQADIATINGTLTCQRRSNAIKLTAKPESAELHAIKNEYGSLDGGDEVWIRGSKMIGNPSVYFEIQNKCYPGMVLKEECHQNLLVVKTPSVPFTEQVVANVVVVTGKDKMRSNILPFTFIPNGAPAIFYHKPTDSSMDCPLQYSRLSPCYSPQPPTPSSAGCFTAEDLPFYHSTPPANELEGLLDICAQQLDEKAEEKILPTAVLSADSSSLAVEELDEKELPTVVTLPPNTSCLDIQDLDKNNKENILPPPSAAAILFTPESNSVTLQGISQSSTHMLKF